jgi:hypothetical protein
MSREEYRQLKAIAKENGMSAEAYILDFLERTVPTLDQLESAANREDIAISEYEK